MKTVVVIFTVVAITLGAVVATRASSTPPQIPAAVLDAPKPAKPTIAQWKYAALHYAICHGWLQVPDGFNADFPGFGFPAKSLVAWIQDAEGLEMTARFDRPTRQLLRPYLPPAETMQPGYYWPE